MGELPARHGPAYGWRSLGSLVRRLRQEADLTQRELGRMILYSRTQRGRCKNAEHQIPLGAVTALDRALGTRGTLIWEWAVVTRESLAEGRAVTRPLAKGTLPAPAPETPQVPAERPKTYRAPDLATPLP